MVSRQPLSGRSCVGNGEVICSLLKCKTFIKERYETVTGVVETIYMRNEEFYVSVVSLLIVGE